MHHEPGTAVPTAPPAGGALPVARLRAVPPRLRAALRRRRINTCGQLLRAAADAKGRGQLARAAGVDPGALLALVRRADLARVEGVGTVFGMMLEDLGVVDVRTLAGQEPGPLHARLREYNREERLARRAPTLEEVEDWVGQARGLPVLVGD